jgi:hypothetical protein
VQNSTHAAADTRSTWTAEKLAGVSGIVPAPSDEIGALRKVIWPIVLGAHCFPVPLVLFRILVIQVLFEGLLVILNRQLFLPQFVVGSAKRAIWVARVGVKRYVALEQISCLGDMVAKIQVFGSGINGWLFDLEGRVVFLRMRPRLRGRSPDDRLRRGKPRWSTGLLLRADKWLRADAKAHRAN